MVLHFEIIVPRLAYRIKCRPHSASTARVEYRGSTPAISWRVLFYLGESGFVKEFQLPTLLPFWEQISRTNN